MFILGHANAPESKYKNLSYPSKPFIRFVFLSKTRFLFSFTAKDVAVLPGIEFIFANWSSYNSTNLSLYLKFFKRSVALPKCTKLSKW